MNKTLFSFEVPIKHLQDFDSQQDYLFTLSFLFESLDYKKYVLGFRDRHPERVMILDNSYNELKQATPGDKLQELFNYGVFDYVVSPDSDDWGQEANIRSYAKMVRAVGKKNVIPVARTKHEIEYFKSVRAARISIPYEYRMSMHPNTVRGTHFLGLNCPAELLTSEPLTCDTGMPIKLAVQGTSFFNWVKSGCPHIQTVPDFFNYEMSGTEITLAHLNIDSLRFLLQEGGI